MTAAIEETPLTLLAYEPCLVFAAIDHDHDGYDHLAIIESRRNSMDDPWMAPVRGVLTSRCHSWVSSMATEDEDMMGGQAIEHTYHLWPECPGYAEPWHTCSTPA